MAPPAETITNLRVPRSVVADPARFGGTPIGDCLAGDLVVQDGRAVALTGQPGSENTARLILPKLTEPHVHLDKCHTIHRMPDAGGDLLAAGEAMALDKVNWTPDDLRARAGRGLDDLIHAGCGAVRSHVDWSWGEQVFEPPSSWPVLTELAREVADQIRLDLSILVGIDDLARDGVADALARYAREARGTLGAFVLYHPNRQEGLRATFAAADKHGLALDFHVDESLDPAFNGLEDIADIALETGHAGPILCGHVCSLSSRSPDDIGRIADKLARAGIHVVTLPTSNLYLQDRRDGTPDRRGITRVHELMRHGVQVSVGTDNVGDAYCPVGQHDPLNSLGLAMLTAHLDPPFARWLPMVTTTASAAIGRPAITVDGASLSDLLAWPVARTDTLFAGARPAPTPLSPINRSL